MQMKIDFKFKYQVCLWKSYFDKGLGLTNYFKYILGFFALSSMNVSQTMIFAVIYFLFCGVLGFVWFKYEWIKAEIEVGNRYNIFVEEMRKKFEVRKYSVNRKI